MSECVISISFKASAKPCDGLEVRADCQFAHADKHEPDKSAGIARGQSKSLLDVRLHFLAATRHILAKSNEPVRIRQIPVKRESLLTFGNTLSTAERLHLNCTQKHVSHGMVGDERQHSDQRRLGGSEMSRSNIGHKGPACCHIDLSRTDRRFNVSGIKRKRT